MKKRLLALLLALVLCLGLGLGLAVPSFAAESDFSIDRNGVLTRYNGRGGAVVIPDGVTQIKYDAFRWCESLTSVVIPEGVEKIGDSAFLGCNNLTSVTIPSSVTYIGGAAFQGCTSLTSANIPGSAVSIPSAMFFDCTSLTTVDIGYGVTDIGSLAFVGCSSLKNVSIPDSVTKIGDSAFARCSSLINVTIPDGVTDISKRTFEFCTSLTNINIPDSITEIEEYAFAGCKNLSSISIPSGITKIKMCTFSSCTNLTNVVVPRGVTAIGDYAFSNCLKLRCITIPDSVTKIGSYAFSDSKDLRDIYFAGSEAQWKNALSSYNIIPSSATIHYNSTGPGNEPAKPDEDASDGPIIDETVLQAKRLLHSSTFSFYRNWASPVQTMAKQLAGTPSVTWYTIENFTDIYYKSAKNGDLSTNDVGEASTVEFYEYLLFKLLDSKELKYFSITEPFGLVDDLSDNNVDGAFLKKLIKAGFKEGTKISDENKSKIKKICEEACGSDALEDIGWIDALLVSGKTIDKFAKEFVNLYALTTVTEAREQAIEMIGDNTQIPALRTAAKNVCECIRRAKKEGVDYCVSGGVEASMDSLAAWSLGKMVDAICEVHPASSVWKKTADSTTFLMDTIFLTDDIATDTIYILGMANVEKAILSAIDQAEKDFSAKESVDNAERLIALADTLKRALMSGCDLIDKQISHCERSELNWHGIWDLLGMIKTQKFDFEATFKWIFGDKDSSYAKMHTTVAEIKGNIKSTDFFAGETNILELLQEVKSTTPSPWAKGEVEKAIGYGILPEWMRNNYQYNITRLEFCALLGYMIEEKTGKTAASLADELEGKQGGCIKPPFNDALYMEVNDIARLGIISGVGGNNFNPLGEITRQEAATMLYRTAKVLGYDTSANAANFPGVANWASQGVDFVVSKGIMAGTDHGFSPTGKYTKEQAVLTMVRFFENVK